ncbi:MAG TPA: hypothetical protein PK054_03430 [Anaerohalosphaeraceae bacterium]|nr:hypothetical protein [Anaerohalosphaeraceae bacterium]HOL89417.1 hypothetical protein [Anaerohalosphaeraceae bacterium]HPP55613.1 hypothetical protein [Anaerohalosphaeraceae bacterium]
MTQQESGNDTEKRERQGAREIAPGDKPGGKGMGVSALFFHALSGVAIV